MSTGAKMLALMTLAVILGMLNALYLRRLADRVERGETIPGASNVDPVQMRKSATLLFWGMLPVWIVIALVSFGVIPTGIDTIKF